MYGMVGTVRPVVCKHDPEQVNSPETTVPAASIACPPTELISCRLALACIAILSPGGEGSVA